MRRVVIGDVHGQLEALKGLLAAVGVGVDDQVIFVGDLVDRGPDGPGVVQFVADLCRARMAVLVLGNHEYKYLRHARNGTTDPDSDGALLTPEQLSFLGTCPIHYGFSVGEQRYLVAHGGIKPSMEVLPTAQVSALRLVSGKDKKAAESLMYLRSDDPEPWTKQYDGRFGIVLYGHSAAPDFQVAEHSIGLDVGAGVGYGFLGCVVLEAGSAPVFHKQQIK
jgi:hypothetical protein